jgi:hypothetical protein
MTRHAARVALLSVALIAGGLAGCGGRGDTTAATLEPRASVSASVGQTDLDLATLRRITAPFQSFETAKREGWSTKITSCMRDPTLGGMGFHYGNAAFIDSVARVDQPEALLYQPLAGGVMQLVAVEYVVPLGAWHGARPPRLFNHDFKVNSTFGVWALHVWLWKTNPSGTFADWNPKVNCEHTTDLQPM